MPLKQPRDISITSVTDSTGAITLVSGLDYTVNQATDPWQIQILNGATVIANHILSGAPGFW